MKPIEKCLAPWFGVCLLFSASTLKGDSKNLADYTLRIRIYSRAETTFYHGRIEEEAKGEGRGDLFEGDEVHGVDFNFACDEKVKPSFGYETYPARWKKPGQVLTVLLPIFGKSNAYFTCNFNTAIKDFVYNRRQGKLSSEPEARYKAWMVKHDYDPVHGKNTPAKLDAKEDADQEDTAPAPAPAAAPAPQR
jgi:hypothetical protein